MKDDGWAGATAAGSGGGRNPSPLAPEGWQRGWATAAGKGRAGARSHGKKKVEVIR